MISKVFNNAPAQVFRFPLTEANEPLTLQLVATTKIKSPVTGADISADGRLLGLVSKAGACVFRIDGDVARVADAPPHCTKLTDKHIEGCCFVPEGLLARASGGKFTSSPTRPFAESNEARASPRTDVGSAATGRHQPSR